MLLSAEYHSRDSGHDSGSPRRYLTHVQAGLPASRRLKLRMALACDPTVIYAALIEGRYRGKIYQSDLDRNSPYNTYKRAGLPPGPIASPGLSSIEAALNPANTEFLYYVRNPDRNDGAHNFYTNEAEFQRGVQALRQWERNRNAQNSFNGNNSNAEPTQNSN